MKELINLKKKNKKIDVLENELLEQFNDIKCYIRNLKGTM